MDDAGSFLNPAAAARRLGVSAKALRLYESRGLLAPLRTQAGWRAYGPRDLGRAAEIVALRSLGFSLSQVGRVLNGDGSDLGPALAGLQARLEAQSRGVAQSLLQVRNLRRQLADGLPPTLAQLVGLATAQPRNGPPELSIALPWPWGDDVFELGTIAPINWIVGPLGSGKTRLAKAIAAAIPGAVFSPMERVDPAPAEAIRRQTADAALAARVTAAATRLGADGARVSDALLRLLDGLETSASAALVVDMVEAGLDAPTQVALAGHLRRVASRARPLFLMTRSSSMLDLQQAGAGEQILFCPANHSVPLVVVPLPGAPGIEAVASCLGSPEARARTEGMVASGAPPH